MQDKLLCDHAAECGQICKHATTHESYGQQCDESWLCVHVRVGERTVCKSLATFTRDMKFPLKEKEEK